MNDNSYYSILSQPWDLKEWIISYFSIVTNYHSSFTSYLMRIIKRISSEITKRPRYLLLYFVPNDSQVSSIKKYFYFYKYCLLLQYLISNQARELLLLLKYYLYLYIG